MKKMSSIPKKGMSCGGGVKAMAKGGMVKSSSCGSKGYMKGGAVRGQGAASKANSCKVY